MLKPLIKSVILSFQPLQAVGKETDPTLIIKILTFYYLCAILPIQGQEVMSQLLSEIGKSQLLQQLVFLLYIINKSI